MISESTNRQLRKECQDQNKGSNVRKFTVDDVNTQLALKKRKKTKQESKNIELSK